MTDVETCKHKMGWDEPTAAAGGWVGQGLICKKCGFQTLTVDTYIPVGKVCSCGNQFDGDPDQDGETCMDCFHARLDAWMAQIHSCPHENLRRGLCADCGTGWHGKHQWRWRALRRIENVKFRLGRG
jgi:hypothetical protein